MIINSHSIKLTGKAELSEPLEIDKNYKVILQGSIISSADHSNQNGTADRTYILKPVLVELIDEIGVTIKVKDMRKMSQNFAAHFVRNGKRVEKTLTKRNTMKER